ncbi:hypothetical protein JQ760_030480 (plasmid) [Klebsiella pneumoniae]|nr:MULTISPECIES: hypothetical protein [Klebsiella/Raoultella group]
MPVSRVRSVRDGRLFRSGPASLRVYASPSPFKERPSSRFRGINPSP